MKTQILSVISEGMHLNRLQGATEYKVKNAFFSNYLAALILLRLQDLKGLMLINDPSHAKLTKFNNNMSDINFWGRSLFYPTSAEVKNRLSFGHDKLLAQEAGRILDSRIQKMMKVPLTSPDQVDWDDTIAALLLLKHRFDLQSSYFNNITFALHKWDSLRDGEKKRAINQSFMYLMQSDPQSGLISRMRSLSGTSMVTGLANIAQKLIGFKRINEDDGGGETSTAGIGSTDGGNAIVSGVSGSSVDQKQDFQNIVGGIYTFNKKFSGKVNKKNLIFRDGKIIKKRVKTFAPKVFKAPEYLKIKVKKQGDE